MPLSTFLNTLWSAIAFALLVFPLSAIAIGTVLLMLVSIVEMVGIDPHFLSSLVYYGVLYGPFYVVYWKAKNQLVSEVRASHDLPI